MPLYRCWNYGPCVRANSREPFELPPGMPPICPEPFCQRPLQELESPRPRGRRETPRSNAGSWLPPPPAGGREGQRRNLARWIPVVLFAAAAMPLLAIIVVVASKLSAGPRDPSAAGAAIRSAPAPAPMQIVLRLSGSNTIGPKLAPALIQGFMAQRMGATLISFLETAPEEELLRVTLPGGDVGVEIRSHGSAHAFTDLLAGTCDIGMASRPVNVKEGGALRAAGMGDFSSSQSEFVIGLDGLAIIVNAASSIHSLTRTQIRQVFAGDIHDWKELGGSNGAIATYSRPTASSGTYDTFNALVLNGTGRLKPETVQIEDSGELVNAVAHDPLGIGFVGFGYLSGASGVRAVAVGDSGTPLREPTVMTIATEDYVLHRRLYFYVPQTRHEPLVDQFVAFVQSDEGQKIVSDAGFVGQNIQDNLLRSSAAAKMPPDDASPEYRMLFTTATRLPTTIKFQTGSAALDSKASTDLERIVRHVAHDHGGHVVLVGFCDSLGDPQRNLKLSLDRAMTVAEQLEIRGVKVEIRGEGQRSPVQSNETNAGREANRRVEVWLQR